MEMLTDKAALTAMKDAVVFHAGTRKQDGKFLTNGGRIPES